MRKDPSPPLRMASPVSDGEDSAYASMTCDAEQTKARSGYSNNGTMNMNMNGALNGALNPSSRCSFSFSKSAHPHTIPHNTHNYSLPPTSSHSSDGFSIDALKRQMDAAFGFTHGFQIKVLGVPMQNARSRVETQTKLCLQMVDAAGNKTSTWSHLRLPELLVTKEKLRKNQAVVDYSLIPNSKVLDVQAVVLCASDPSKHVQICSGCQLRESKRGKKKSDTSGDIKVEEGGGDSPENEAAKIVLFNCGSYVDFSSGDTILPTRITCYCRHHNEKIGFCVYFIARDHNSSIVATGISPPILITDDHKGTKNKMPSVTQTSAATPQLVSANSPVSTVGQKRLRADDPVDTIMQDGPVSPPNTILRSQTSDFGDDVIAQFIPALLASDTNAPLFENFGIREEPDSDFRRTKKVYQSPPPAQLAPAPPTAVINRIIPGEGPIQGGVEVTILGDHMHNGLIAVFGDMEAVTTQVWGTSTMICILPPSSSPGPVPVTLKSIPGLSTDSSAVPGSPEIPCTFLYKDDLDRSLMELALQVVGLRMTGSLDSARNIAMRIVNETAQETMNDSALTFNELKRNQLETAVINAFLSLEAHSNELDTVVLTSLLDMTFHSGGLNLLHLAAYSGMTTLVKYLLSMDCDVNPRDKNGYTPLMVAIHAGNTAIVRILLQAGASRVLTSRNNVSSFQLAKQRGTKEFNEFVEELSQVAEEDEEYSEELIAMLANESCASVSEISENASISTELARESILHRRQSIVDQVPSITSLLLLSPIFAPTSAPLSPAFSDMSLIDSTMTFLPPAMEISKRVNGKHSSSSNKEKKAGTLHDVNMRWSNPEAELKNIMDGFKSFAFMGPMLHTIAAPLMVQRVDVFSQLSVDNLFEKSQESNLKQQPSMDKTVSIPFSGYVERETDCDCTTWSQGMGHHEPTCAKLLKLERKQAKRLRRQQRAIWLFWLPLLIVVFLLVAAKLLLSSEEVDAVLGKILMFNSGMVTHVKDAVHGLRKEGKSLFLEFLNTGFGGV